MKYIDTFLNKYTMYRIVGGVLGFAASYAILLAIIGLLPHSPISLLLSLCISIISTVFATEIGARIVRTTPNLESAGITGLILFFIFSPPDIQFWSATQNIDFTQDINQLIVLLAAGLLAGFSKYIFAIKRTHIANPAAIAALLISIFGFYGVPGFYGASWWVATPLLFPVFAIGGFCVVRKIRKIGVIATFLLTAIISLLFSNFTSLGFALPEYIAFSRELLFSWPLLFFATIMLTEPYTMPARRTYQLYFAILVGWLFGSRFSIGPLFSTPETALVLGNIFTYAVNPRVRMNLTLVSIKKHSQTLHEYIFNKPQNFTFQAGQYLEWTMPWSIFTTFSNHKELLASMIDGRGIRRYFTIASAPSEPQLSIGVSIPIASSQDRDEQKMKHAAQPSFFKQKLRSMKPGDSIIAGQLAGDFVLPDIIELPDLPVLPNKPKLHTTPKLQSIPNQSKQSPCIVCIAGGIGITPFRSMIMELLLKKKSAHNPKDTKATIALFYCVSNSTDLIYDDIFKTASKEIGLAYFPVITRKENAPKNWAGVTGRLSAQSIGAALIANKPDFDLANVEWYLSGPNLMVEAYCTTLKEMGVSTLKIHTDYFPGF